MAGTPTKKQPQPAEKPAEKQPKPVPVVLSCTYSGNGFDANAGSTIEVDQAEADRLIGLGVARSA